MLTKRLYITFTMAHFPTFSITMSIFPQTSLDAGEIKKDYFLAEIPSECQKKNCAGRSNSKFAQGLFSLYYGKY